MRLRGLLAAGFTCAALWSAPAATAGNICHRGPTQGAGDTVHMLESCFTPTVLEVDPGDQVTFVNKDPVPHNISADWGRGTELKTGESFHAFFDEEGTFPYACTYHYGMTGAIVVGDGEGLGTGTPVDSASAVDTTPVSEERSSSGNAGGSGILGWVVAGAIGLLLGAGLMGVLRRERPED